MKKSNIKVFYVVGAAALMILAAVLILNGVSVGIVGGADGPTSVYVK